MFFGFLIPAENCSKISWKVIISIGIIVLIGIIISVSILNKNWNDEHRVNSYVCPMCNSTCTSGFDTFWHNDGTLCNGSREYCLEHADFTIMHCSECGTDFRLYRNQW